MNYAQARYLCYYLQEKGVLVKFYREFQARQKEDPSGFKALQKILAETRHGRVQNEVGKICAGFATGPYGECPVMTLLCTKSVWRLVSGSLLVQIRYCLLTLFVEQLPASLYPAASASATVLKKTRFFSAMSR